MDAETTTELVQVLTEALKYVRVQRKRGEQVELQSYRRGLQTCRTVWNPALLLEIGLCDIEITDSHVKERALDLIASALSDFVQDQKIQSATYAIWGGLGPGVSIDRVLSNVVLLAIVDGVPTAVQAFYDCATKRSASYWEFHLLSGINAHREVQLFDSVSLIPLPGSTAELPSHLPLTFGDTSQTTFLSATLLGIERSVTPIFVNPATISQSLAAIDSEFEIRSKSVDVPEFDLNTFCHALSLTCDSSVKPVMSWSSLLDYEIFDLRSPMGVGSYGWSGDVSQIKRGGRVTLDAVQLDNAKALYHKLVRLPSDIRDKLEVPINRWTKSQEPSSLVDKMIDLGIALESIYLSDNDLGEITFKLSVRAAWHLGRDKAERDRLSKEFRVIYGRRSRAVHRGTLPQTTKVAGNTVSTSDLVKDTQQLCSRSIKTIISAGEIPNWDELILGA